MTLSSCCFEVCRRPSKDDNYEREAFQQRFKVIERNVDIHRRPYQLPPLENSQSPEDRLDRWKRKKHLQLNANTAQSNRLQALGQGCKCNTLKKRGYKLNIFYWSLNYGTRDAF